MYIEVVLGFFCWLVVGGGRLVMWVLRDVDLYEKTCSLEKCKEFVGGLKNEN